MIYSSGDVKRQIEMLFMLKGDRDLMTSCSFKVD